MRMTWNRILERISSVVATAKHIWDEVFRERELILRSQGRVHFVPLTRRLQMCAVSIVLAVAIWGIGVTLMALVLGIIPSFMSLSLRMKSRLPV